MSDRSVTPPITAEHAARVTPGQGTVVHRKPLTVVISTDGDPDRAARGITEVVDRLVAEGDLTFGPVAAGLQQFVVDHQPTGVAAVLDVAPDAIAFLFDRAAAIGDATTHRASGRSGWTTVFVEGDSVSLVAGPGPERPVDPWSRLWAGTVSGQGVQVDLSRSAPVENGAAVPLVGEASQEPASSADPESGSESESEPASSADPESGSGSESESESESEARTEEPEPGAAPVEEPEPVAGAPDRIDEAPIEPDGADAFRVVTSPSPAMALNADVFQPVADDIDQGFDQPDGVSEPAAETESEAVADSDPPVEVDLDPGAESTATDLDLDLDVERGSERGADDNGADAAQEASTEPVGQTDADTDTDTVEGTDPEAEASNADAVAGQVDPEADVDTGTDQSEPADDVEEADEPPAASVEPGHEAECGDGSAGPDLVIELDADPIDLSPAANPAWTWPPPQSGQGASEPVETMVGASTTEPDQDDDTSKAPVGRSTLAALLGGKRHQSPGPSHPGGFDPPAAGRPPSTEAAIGQDAAPRLEAPPTPSQPWQGPQPLPAPPPAPAPEPWQGPEPSPAPPPSRPPEPIAGPPPMPGRFPPPADHAEPIAGPPPMPDRSAAPAPQPEPIAGGPPVPGDPSEQQSGATPIAGPPPMPEPEARKADGGDED